MNRHSFNEIYRVAPMRMKLVMMKEAFKNSDYRKKTFTKEEVMELFKRSGAKQSDFRRIGIVLMSSGGIEYR